MRKALVYGCNGALGKHVLNAFKSRGWGVFGVDVAHNGDVTLGHSTVTHTCTLEEMQRQVFLETNKHSFDALINVAGGWAGGSIADESTAAATDLMLKQSVYSSIVTSYVASQRGKEGALVVMTGSAASLNGTPGMVGYGLAKAAVHHLVKSIAADPSKLPVNATVFAVLPVTLDTPGNRAAMPGADFSSWTPCDVAASLLVDWAESSPKLRPASGSLLVWNTKNGVTTTTAS